MIELSYSDLLLLLDHHVSSAWYAGFYEVVELDAGASYVAWASDVRYPTHDQPYFFASLAEVEDFMKRSKDEWSSQDSNLIRERWQPKDFLSMLSIGSWEDDPITGLRVWKKDVFPGGEISVFYIPNGLNTKELKLPIPDTPSPTGEYYFIRGETLHLERLAISQAGASEIIGNWARRKIRDLQSLL